MRRSETKLTGRLTLRIAPEAIRRVKRKAIDDAVTPARVIEALIYYGLDVNGKPIDRREREVA